MTDHRTLPEILAATARGRGDAVAITWLRDGEQDAADISYGELARRSAGVAAVLRGRVAAGERALILGDAEPLFVAAFLGCLQAGIIAVPAATPRGNQSLAMLESIAADCRPGACLMAGLPPRMRARLQSAEALRAMQWIDVEAIGPAAAIEAFAPADLRNIAYLQYTSGSTGEPRGVMISHQNLICNQQMMAEVAGHDCRTRYVGWLPLFHDMGLAGIVLQSLFLGAHCVLMPARFFMQKPIRWLSAISRYRATSSAAPDFAYDLCAGTVGAEEAAGLDLGTWTTAISGGEPVRAQTLARFAEKFRPSGFRSESWLPCYGLAESTCLVTGPPRGREPMLSAAGDGRPVVSCGFPRQGQQVRIVAPDAGTICPERRPGEIWVAGPAVGRGYWGWPDETRAIFQATLAAHDSCHGLQGGDGRSWLRTGDLGFVAGGQLFVTGRLKDLIIVRGVNHAPQAIEQTARGCNAALAGGRGAAFAVESDSQERLVVVQEIARAHRAGVDAAAVIADVRQAVAAEHGVQPQAIVLVRPGSLPITTSGKIRRGECRRQFLSGELKVIESG